MDPVLDRLACVSQIMFDQRILDLVKENNALRCDLALLRYGGRELNIALADANDNGITEVCKCAGCFMSKRFSIVEPEDLAVRFTSSEVANQTCILQKCLLWQCAQLGLSCELIKELDHMDDLDEVDVIAARHDFHLIIVDKGGFWEVVYGAKLPAADFHNIPSLQGLKALFAMIDEGTDFFIVDGKDYSLAAEEALRPST